MGLKIDRLKKIEPKKDPYVYQDLEFGLNYAFELATRMSTLIHTG